MPPPSSKCQSTPRESHLSSSTAPKNAMPSHSNSLMPLSRLSPELIAMRRSGLLSWREVTLRDRFPVYFPILVSLLEWGREPFHYLYMAMILPLCPLNMASFFAPLSNLLGCAHGHVELKFPSKLRIHQLHSLYLSVQPLQSHSYLCLAEYQYLTVWTSSIFYSYTQKVIFGQSPL